MPHRILPSLCLFLFLILAVLLASCGRASQEAAPTATPAPTNTPAPVAPDAPVQLRDAKLLSQAGTSRACDTPIEGQLTCASDTKSPLLTVDVSAASYARWSLRWAEIAQPLDGTETLHLRIKQSGELTPNLYFVEQDGTRVAVRLSQFGLRGSLNNRWQDVYIPLPEVVSEEDTRPDFSRLTELQTVFEWADMAGNFEIDEVEFLSIWQTRAEVADASTALAAALAVPDEFVVEAVADELEAQTQIQFAPDGSMLVSLQNGRVLWLRDGDGNGTFEERHLYASGLPEVVGLLIDPLDDAVWLGGRGQLYRTLDADENGVADTFELRIDGLPWGRHQNNGLAWNPDPDPFTGEAGQHFIYFGLGSTEDLEDGGPLNSTVLRFPRSGQGAEALEVVSRGNRNPYAVVWAPVPVDLAQPDGKTRWQLFASENGPDFNDAPDEVNHIRWQHHYGFPTAFGLTEAYTETAEIAGLPYSGSIYAVTPHASASGLMWVSNASWPAAYRTLYVSLFGQVFSPDIVGHTVDAIALEEVETPTGLTYRGTPTNFITGLDRPLPLAVDPAGDLIVGDYATGVIYRVRYVGD